MELKRIKQEINRLEAYKADESITDSGLELLKELKYTTEAVKNNAVLPLVNNRFSSLKNDTSDANMICLLTERYNEIAAFLNGC